MYMYSQTLLFLYLKVHSFLGQLEVKIWAVYSLVWWFMVFNATFNNISAVLWLSVLLVEETRVFGKNHRSVTSL